MLRRGWLVVLLLSCTSSLFAQIPLRGSAYRESSRIIVGRYCRMDYDGGRLQKDAWPRMKPLTTWRDNPDWQSFTIVSQYELLSANDGLRGATVTVEYRVLGRFEPGIGYSPEPGREDVSFYLRDVNSAWKIDEVDPVINPHVSKPRAVEWLKTALASEKDAANRIALEKALNTLTAKP